MESSLTNAYKIKIQNFEGPFDLLFHLLEKDKINIYDIPISEITDQYLEYLFAMRQLDLEIASEFLVMAATLLQIKSRMLLPELKEKDSDEEDPREDLVMKLIRYRKYKEFAAVLKTGEEYWSQAVYKVPEIIEFAREDEILELSLEKLTDFYTEMLRNNINKKNEKTRVAMHTIVQHEKVSIRVKIREVLHALTKKLSFKFSDMFSLKKQSRLEVVTGFLAVLEVTKLKKARIEQKKHFDEIMVYTNTDKEVSEEDADS